MLRKIIFTIYIFAALLVAAPVYAGLTLDDLIDSALENNPELKAAEARWRMFERKIDQVNSLNDPKLSFALSSYPINSLASDETPMTGNDLRIDQSFPFPGKLDAKGDAARQQAIWYQKVYEDARLQLVGKVKSVWYRRYYVARALDVTDRNLRLLDDIITLAETRYAVGSGLQQDVLRAQLERSKLLDRQYALKQQRDSLRAEFQRLIASIENDKHVPPNELIVEPVHYNADDLYEVARQQRPMIVAYQALLESYEAKRRSATLDSYPDFNLWVSYRQRDDVSGDPVSGTDFVSTGVSINLPIFKKKRVAAVAETEDGSRMIRHQIADFEDRLKELLRDQLAKNEKNLARIELYRNGIIPLAQQSVDVGLISYQVGDISFVALLDSLLTLDRYQLDLHRATADYLRSHAQLEAAVGGSLDSVRN